MLECLVPTCWNCLGRIRRDGLVGGGMTLGVSFEVSKDHARLSFSSSPTLPPLPSSLPPLPVDQDITLNHISRTMTAYILPCSPPQ